MKMKDVSVQKELSVLGGPEEMARCIQEVQGTRSRKKTQRYGLNRDSETDDDTRIPESTGDVRITQGEESDDKPPNNNSRPQTPLSGDDIHSPKLTKHITSPKTLNASKSATPNKKLKKKKTTKIQLKKNVIGLITLLREFKEEIQTLRKTNEANNKITNKTLKDLIMEQNTLKQELHQQSETIKTLSQQLKLKEEVQLANISNKSRKEQNSKDSYTETTPSCNAPRNSGNSHEQSSKQEQQGRSETTNNPGKTNDSLGETKSPHHRVNETRPPALPVQETYASKVTTTENPQQEQQPSVRTRVKTNKVRRTILLKPRSSQITENDILNCLRELVPPCKIQEVRPEIAKNTVEICCTTEAGKDILKEFLLKEDNMTKNVIIEDKKPPTAKIAVFRIPTDLKEERLIQAISTEDNIFQVERKIPTRDKNLQTSIVSIPLSSARALARKGSIQVGFLNLPCQRQVTVPRCTNCQCLTSECQNERGLCKNKVVCAHCGGQHDSNKCKEQFYYCINCHFTRDKQGRPIYNTNHSASSSYCPTYRQERNRLASLKP